MGLERNGERVTIIKTERIPDALKDYNWLLITSRTLIELCEFVGKRLPDACGGWQPNGERATRSRASRHYRTAPQAEAPADSLAACRADSPADSPEGPSTNMASP